MLDFNTSNEAEETVLRDIITVCTGIEMWSTREKIIRTGNGTLNEHIVAKTDELDESWSYARHLSWRIQYLPEDLNAEYIENAKKNIEEKIEEAVKHEMNAYETFIGLLRKYARVKDITLETARRTVSRILKRNGISKINVIL